MTEIVRRQGEVTEVQPRTATSFTGRIYSDSGWVDLDPRTSHSSHCRVRWEDGRETFFDTVVDFSAGDKIAAFYEGEMLVGVMNLKTRGNWSLPPVAPKGSTTKAGVILAFFVLGLLMLAVNALLAIPVIIGSLIAGVFLTRSDLKINDARGAAVMAAFNAAR